MASESFMPEELHKNVEKKLGDPINSEVDQQIEALLMPWSEYASQEATLLNDCRTEVFRGAVGQQLRYIGAQHTFDPKHPLFDTIDAEWQLFLSESEPAKARALYEGRFAIGQNRESTILSGGECAYVRYLAQQSGVEAIWPEPTREEEVTRLMQRFSHDQIISFYGVRAMYQWHRLMGERPAIEDYLRPYLPKEEGSSFDSSIHSLEDLLGLSPEIFGEQVHLDRRNSLGRLISPRENQSPINELARDLNQFRDVQIVKQIISLWLEQNNLFMVYGNAHLIRQKKALEVMLQVKSG